MPKQHQSGKMRDVMKELKRLGFQVERNKNGTFRIIPPPRSKVRCTLRTALNQPIIQCEETSKECTT